jgi:hypothetical protein
MRLRELLVKVLEGACVRLDGESDEDYIQRCVNAGFERQAYTFYKRKMGTYRKPNIMK